MSAGGAADSLPKSSHLTSDSHGKSEKKQTVTKLINPFDPAKVHGNLTAYHRRWVHCFPQDDRGVAFQTHHKPRSVEGGELELVSTSSSTMSPLGTRSEFSLGGSTIGGNSNSWSESKEEQEFRPLRQIGRRGQGVSFSSSFGDTSGPASIEGSSKKGNVEMKTPEAKRSAATHSHSKFHGDNSGGTERQSSYRSNRGGVTSSVGSSLGPRRHSRYWERRLSDFNSKCMEDFTSVRRRGVDWKSLTEPACLPITIDFFPSKASLDREYYESPSKLVANSYIDSPDVSHDTSR